MAKSEPQEDFIDVEDDSSSEDCVTDDSDEDPTFDIVERTRSSLSKLSLKKSNPRSSKIKDSVRKRKLDFEEVKTPELDEVDEKSFEKVEKLIQDGQLEKLKVDQCKVYLRKHGLRLTGNKDVLIERIREHLGIINGGGELKYPVSSFVLNCKGDACTGDVVMFEQTVYEMYNIASRSASGPPCGTRVVAGRIVKESYGAAKQQHTFTIEVLWSKGEKPLPPLHPLLIKGRNLYRLNTMRQKWTDEAERSRVLLEKHSRGSLARSSRETRIQEKERRKTHKEQRDIRNTNSTHDMIHKENQHPNPNPVKVNYAQPHIVQTQRPQKPVQSTIQPNRILTEINQQSNYKTLPDQIKPQVNYIPEQNASIPGNPNKCLNLNVNQNQMKPLPSQMKPLPNQIKPTVNIIPVQKTSLTDNVSRKWWGNITEVDKQMNAATNQQSYVQSHPSLKFPTQSLPHQLSNQPSHVQQYPNGYHRHPLTTPNLPPKSPMRQQHCKYYHQGRCHFGERCKFLHENRKDQSLNIPPQRPVHQLHNPSHVESYPYVNSRLYPLLHARRDQR